MELTYATIVVLAAMVFVLSGMVGYLYWQQTRILQNIQSLAIVVSTQLAPPPLPEPEAEQEPEHHVEQAAEQDDDEEDDRVSVKEEVERVDGPPTPAESKTDDIDDLDSKTAAQLRDMLTKKGIPFGKRDAKPVLIQLLKATA